MTGWVTADNNNLWWRWQFFFMTRLLLLDIWPSVIIFSRNALNFPLVIRSKLVKCITSTAFRWVHISRNTRFFRTLKLIHLNRKRGYYRYCRYYRYCWYLKWNVDRKVNRYEMVLSDDNCVSHYIDELYSTHHLHSTRAKKVRTRTANHMRL